MQSKVVREVSYLQTSLHSEGYIYANWRGYVTVTQVKEGCKAILQDMKDNGCTMLLNDNRELRGTWTQAIRWLESDFMPDFISMGLERIAFIYSGDPSARYSLDRFLEVNDQYVAQTFESYPLAEDWLLDRIPDEDSSQTPKGSISIRQGETHHLVTPDSILYISCLKGKCVIHTEKSDLEVNHTLKDVLKKLEGSVVTQIHKSYAINTRQISAIKYSGGGAYQAYLHSLAKVRIPVGRKYASELKTKLGIE